MSIKKVDTQLMLSNLENILRHAINNINKQEKTLNSIQEGGGKTKKPKIAKKRKKRIASDISGQRSMLTVHL